MKEHARYDSLMIFQQLYGRAVLPVRKCALCGFRNKTHAPSTELALRCHSNLKRLEMSALDYRAGLILQYALNYCSITASGKAFYDGKSWRALMCQSVASIVTSMISNTGTALLITFVQSLFFDLPLSSHSFFTISFPSFKSIFLFLISPPPPFFLAFPMAFPHFFFSVLSPYLSCISKFHLLHNPFFLSFLF